MGQTSSTDGEAKWRRKKQKPITQDDPDALLINSDALTCNICYGIYTDTPMMLIPCGHSLCNRCYRSHHIRSKQLNNNTVKCPFCQSLIENGVKNYALTNIVDSAAAVTSDEAMGGGDSSGIAASSTSSIDGVSSPQFPRSASMELDNVGPVSRIPRANWTLRVKQLGDQIEDLTEKLRVVTEERDTLSQSRTKFCIGIAIAFLVVSIASLMGR